MNKKYNIALILFLIISLTACGQKNKSISEHNNNTLKTGWYYVSEKETDFKRQLNGSSETYFINPNVIVSVEQFSEIEFVENEYNGKEFFSLIIQFDKEGTKNWNTGTKNAIGSHLAFIVHDKLIAIPMVNAQIPNGISSVSGTKEFLIELVSQIEKEHKVIIKNVPSVNQLKVIIDLPQPQKKGIIFVEESLHNRRSRRQFQDKEISLESLSQILWAAYGVTFSIDNAPSLRGGLRTAPSAGGLYPLEVYAVVGKVEGLEPGLYKYLPKGHKIEKVIDKDIRAELCQAAIGQKMIQEAPVSIVYTAVFSRTTDKYKERGRERYVWIDLGHSAENVYLQVEALGLGTCAIGAFMDDKMRKLLNLPKEEEPLYIMPIGHYEK